MMSGEASKKTYKWMQSHFSSESKWNTNIIRGLVRSVGWVAVALCIAVQFASQFSCSSHIACKSNKSMTLHYNITADQAAMHGFNFDLIKIIGTSFYSTHIK
jgi:hypothetical protein